MLAFAYFKTNAEALHLALSNDGVVWSELCGGKPLLQGTISTKTVRDPFIIRDQNGRYHLLCTDGWASPQLIHAHSDNLMEWSEQRAIGVMHTIMGTRNAWAPEALFDAASGHYLVYWSSTVDTDPHSQARNHRLWYVRTPDFVSFSPPALLFDPCYSIIDSTMIAFKGRFLMVFKDEREEHKGLRVCWAPTPLGPWGEISEQFTPRLVEGPSLAVVGERLICLCDFYGQGRYGGYTSSDGLHWSDSSATLRMSGHPRHGSIFEIDDSHGAALIEHFGITSPPGANTPHPDLQSE